VQDAPCDLAPEQEAHPQSALWGVAQSAQEQRAPCLAEVQRGQAQDAAWMFF